MKNILSPQFFNKWHPLAIKVIIALLPWMFALSLYYALFASPEDYQQGDMVRIMYVHVPSAWMSLGIYSFMAVCSAIAMVWRNKMAYVICVAAAPIGCMFAAITLVTGSLWGKPIWGTWWVWDARLTSMLVLFLLYCSYIAVINSSDNLLRAEKPASVIAIIGFINVPIVKFSVEIWYSLHQPASVLRSGGVAIDISMLVPLFLMFASFCLYFALVLIIRIKSILYKNRIKNVV